MGKTCEPKAFSFQCMTKFTTKKKKKKTGSAPWKSMHKGLLLRVLSTPSLLDISFLGKGKQQVCSDGRDHIWW